MINYIDDDFFARPRFPCNQHRRIDIRNDLDEMHDLLHRLTAADDHIMGMTAQNGDFAYKFIHMLPLLLEFFPQYLP